MAILERDEISDPALRSKYLEETTEKTVRNTRIAAVTAAVFFPVFGILDYVVYPQFLALFLSLRFAVVALSTVVYVLMSTSLGRRYVRIIAMSVYLFCCWSIVAMVHLDGGFSSPYYAGINLVLIGMVFVLPLSTLRTIVICLLIYASYLLPFLWGARVRNVAPFLNNNFFLLSTMILVVLSAYLGSRMRQTEFVARHRLAKANEDLRQLDTLKSQFFANVSHEVRTPLTSVISPVQSMYQGDLGEFTPDQARVIAQVYRNSLRLLDTINQMLEFAKFDAGRMQLRLSRVDLREVVHETVTLFGEVAGRKGLEFTEELEPGLPAVYLDRDKVDRILTNLVRNAIKFTDEGGITVRLSRAGDSIRLEVADTGIGIAPEFLDRIFERFQQVDSSSTRRYEGTGLGLALVKEACEIQHGQVHLDSRVQQGSRFTVELPMNLEELEPEAFLERRGDERRKLEQTYSGPERRQRPRRKQDAADLGAEQIVLVDSGQVAGTDAQEAEPAAADTSETSETIVYVEDNEDLRRYVRTMLQRQGYRVVTASNGRDGVEVTRKLQPAAVVSDVMMPIMDGYELLRMLKGDPETRHIPVIIVTAKSEEESRLEGLEHGADDYISKPINVRELDARLRNALTLQKYHRILVETAQLEQRIKELAVGFSQSLELRDRYTGRHSWDVLDLGTLCAERLGVPFDSTLRDSLLLHDIGKLGIPDRVLLKPGPLDAEEWDIMKEHAELGSLLLRKFESLTQVSEIILAHQEHYDGSGYPRGLAGEDIPLAARIIAVADAWHAMTGDRPYRNALPASEALRELLLHRGKQFDPKVVDALIEGLVAKGELREEDLRGAGFAGNDAGDNGG